MSESIQLVAFRLDDHRYALPLRLVDRIVRAADVTRLPGAPAILFGVINVDGQVLPVLNTRERFRLPQREISPADHFLIARTTRRTVVLVIDEAEAVVELPSADVVAATHIHPGLEQIEGVVKLDGGMVLIHDLERFLSLDEESSLDDAFRQEVAREY